MNASRGHQRWNTSSTDTTSRPYYWYYGYDRWRFISIMDTRSGEIIPPWVSINPELEFQVQCCAVCIKGQREILVLSGVMIGSIFNSHFSYCKHRSMSANPSLYPDPDAVEDRNKTMKGFRGWWWATIYDGDYSSYLSMKMVLWTNLPTPIKRPLGTIEFDSRNPRWSTTIYKYKTTTKYPEEKVTIQRTVWHLENKRQIYLG